ncbi:hypothetical protein CO2235_200229 [Cupriavidus oxalaticus]|uniref:Uncharacterized protein n=1 Tax=Cupriavidus oxalaticus TaxID=96344 RepID=A0A375G150_9BURK|nr:hypothetical protein CO2235_200229 [Cupriavidus oxalaticus]
MAAVACRSSCNSIVSDYRASGSKSLNLLMTRIRNLLQIAISVTGCFSIVTRVFPWRQRDKPDCRQLHMQNVPQS